MPLNPQWLLPDHASPMDVVACDDPTESLARHARLHGLLTLDILTVALPGLPTDDDDINAMAAGMAGHAAQRAFRFAAAALNLDEANHLARELGLRG